MKYIYNPYEKAFTLQIGGKEAILASRKITPIEDDFIEFYFFFPEKLTFIHPTDKELNKTLIEQFLRALYTRWSNLNPFMRENFGQGINDPGLRDVDAFIEFLEKFIIGNSEKEVKNKISEQK